MKSIQYLSICLSCALLFGCTAPDHAVDQEKYKQQILDDFEFQPDLIDVVVRNGWAADGKETLVSRLNAGGCLPTKWLSAVAGLEDPETYPALVGCFVNGRNREQIYRIIRNLPGIQLDAAVPEVWSKVKYRPHSYECRDMIPIAMESGIMESLEFASEALSDDLKDYDSQKSAIRFAIHLYVGEFTTDEDFRIWLVANEGEINFDPEVSRFVGGKVPAEDSGVWKGRGIPGSNFPASGISIENNQEKLTEITLPDSPTRDEIITYIQRIDAAPWIHSSQFPTDPQVGLLMAVGPDNLDLLIDGILCSKDYHLWAINRLVQSEHKELILKKLPTLPCLIQTVLQLGWEKDAKEILVRELTHQTDLPPQWVPAVAGFEDPATYPDLITYFERGASKPETYEALRNLKAIDLTEAIPKVWKQIRYSSNSWDIMRIIPVAMEYGIVDSLSFASKELQSDPWIFTYDQRVIREAVHRYVGVFDSVDSFSKWLDQNKGTIRFDKKTGTFIGKYPPDQPVNPDARRNKVIRVSLSVMDMENALRLISLPDEPSPEDVKAYIKQVRDACGGKRTSETEPMRIAKLIALGSEHSALLIQESEWIDGYAIPAIKELVRPEDKVLLFNNLNRVPSFMAVVLDQGWEGEIKEFILEKIRKGYYPISWVQAAIRFDEPEAYDAALEHFVRTTKRYKVYQEIKNAPGIDKEALEVAVPKAWKQSKQGRFPVEWWTMIPVALEHGIQDSLYFAAKALLDDQTINENFRNKVRAAVHKHVGQFATDEAFREWLTVNKGTIQFDPKTKMFSGTQLAAPQPEPTAASAE